MPLTAKEKSSALKILNWYKKKPSPYYLKRDKVHETKEPLAPDELVKEHMAACLYRLAGVTTPDTMITQNDSKDRFFLASKKLAGYKDLKAYLPDGFIDELDAKDVPAEREAFFKVHTDKFSLSVEEKARLLVAAIWLQDLDVIGRNLTNVGLIRSEGKYHIVKIDPGGAILRPTSTEEFTKALACDYRLLHRDFSEPTFNNPRVISGNLHFLEFFHDVKIEDIKRAILTLNRIEDSEIHNLVNNPSYHKLLDESVCKKIADMLISRRQVMLEAILLNASSCFCFFSSPPESKLTPYGLKPASFPPALISEKAFEHHFDKRVPEGNSKPHLAFK